MQSIMKNVKKKKKFQAPSALVLIFVLIIVVSLLSYIMPVGNYERYKDEATGRDIVDASSYHAVEKNPMGIADVLMAIPKGMNGAASIINFLFIIGGAFGVLTATGAMDAFLNSAVKKLNGRERLIIPFFLIFWALGGSILGNFEEALAFIPMQIALCMALGFDSIVGVAIGMLGVCVGYMGAIMNPFTVGIAQQIAGLPLYSGMGYRFALWGVMLIISIAYVWNYAGKIKKDPTTSLVYEEDKNSKYKDQHFEGVEFTNKHKLVFVAFFIGVLIVIYGVIEHGFYITEMGAVFVGLAIAMGLLGGLRLNGTVDAFVNGAHNLLFAAICVGFARALTVIMTEANIMDTLVYNVTYGLKSLPPTVSAPLMFVVQALINILIPSGSGQAVVTMPIMIPIADVLGISRQTAVLAFQAGDGITNIFSPTNGSLMAALAIGGFSINKWIKWFWKLFVIWSIVIMIALALSVVMGYGPF